MTRQKYLTAVAVVLMCAGMVWAVEPLSQKVYPGADGKLVYAADEQGNTIPDFSQCGYQGGGVALPDVPVKLVLEPANGAEDDTARIQAALNELSDLPLDSTGFRGTLLLKKGVYPIAGTLKISRSGIVLRGEGSGKDGTVLFATGKNKRALIHFGVAKGVAEKAGTRVKITDGYVPVGARTLSLSSASGYKVGDSVVVLRIVNQAWIHEIGMDDIPKRPGDPDNTKNWESQGYQIGYNRVITAIEENKITLDAPIVCAIDERWGGGEVFKFTDSRTDSVGVENLRVVSEFDSSVVEKEHYSDENKCETAVLVAGVKNGWVRDIIAVHVDKLVHLERAAQWITVQDCAYLDPVSRVTGMRRYAFKMAGQQCLMQRCYSEGARHACVFDSRVPGPDVFLDCLTVQNYGSSEPHHRWSTGGLYDNFSGNLAIINRAWLGSGHGWTAGNFVAWNTEGKLSVQSPPAATNYAIGHIGEKAAGLIKEMPDGWWESLGAHVAPRSLYLAQLKDRLGEGAVRAVTTEFQRQGSLYTELENKYATRHEKVWGAGTPAEIPRPAGAGSEK
jgi:hypothetical protein